MEELFKNECKSVQKLISEYFTLETWALLPEALKSRYLTMTRNYVDYPEEWEFNPMPKPDFMLQIKRKAETEISNSTINKQQYKIETKTTEKLTGTKPKRNLPSKNYYEEEEPASDRYVFCDNCEQDYVDYCTTCGMLIVIKDTPVPMGVEDRARKTAPKGILEVRPSRIHGMGVFALRNIQKGVRLGPYEGKVTRVDTSLGYAWKLRDGRLIDASNEENSNYLRFVNCARNVNEQNLVAYQYQGQLYYRTSRIIQTGEELLVYYGSSFAKNLGIDIKKYFEPQNETSQPDFYACSFCYIGLSTEEYKGKHELRCKFNPKNIYHCLGDFKCRYCHCNVTSQEFLDNHEKYCRSKKKDVKRLEQTDVEELKTYKCIYCEYETKVKGSLKTHILHIHEKENVKIYYCKFCVFRSYYKGNFVRHLKIHKKNHQFVCKECSLSFNRKQYLDGHILKNHVEKINLITSKIHSCTFCSYRTVQINNLKNHKCKAKIKNDKPDEINSNKLFCYNCNFNTTYKSNLISHMKIHTNENKKFICMDCRKTFNTKWNLDYHILAKHKNKIHLIKSITNKIHICNICHYRTVATTHLKSHIKTHLK